MQTVDVFVGMLENEKKCLGNGLWLLSNNSEYSHRHLNI